ncbi:MAG: sulfatase-like hydrolase/transferase, partial [Myxococcota bacterium]|nr:sulfatase-like hydrolase/transferase [Myxococcota bacterium]
MPLIDHRSSLLSIAWITLTITQGCAEPELPPPEVSTPTVPDILLITVDTLRADRVGAYGDPLAQTPTIDALAREGALFREAHAVTPLTLPSHASILTGLWPSHHGLRDN